MGLGAERAPKLELGRPGLCKRNGIRSNVSGNALFSEGAKNFQRVLATTWVPQFGVPHLGARIKDGGRHFCRSTKLSLRSLIRSCACCPTLQILFMRPTSSPAPSTALAEAIAPRCAEVFRAPIANASIPQPVRGTLRPQGGKNKAPP